MTPDVIRRLFLSNKMKEEPAWLSCVGVAAAPSF
jgi:hypothetical protein